MATEQSAILPEDVQACIVVEGKINDLEKVKEICKQSLEFLEKRKQEDPKAQLSMAIGFGNSAWNQLKRGNEAKELKDFPRMGGGMIPVAPSTQQDFCLHIQGQSLGACVNLFKLIFKTFGEAITVDSETHGYRLHEDRGHEGFVDGTENPKEKLKRYYGIIPEGEEDAGGSYLMIQRYLHDLSTWSQLSKLQQQTIIGRTREDNIEIPKENQVPVSHLSRVDIAENGEDLKIVRQSLPFGNVSGDFGLIFIAYCYTLYNIEKQIKRMFGEDDGRFDFMLRFFSKPISGAYYFVPSIERLKDL